MTVQFHRRGLLFAALLTAGAAMPATAATFDPTGTTNGKEQSVETQSQASRPQLYCQVETFTGSRISKKVCKTRQQWIDETGVDPETLKR